MAWTIEGTDEFQAWFSGLAEVEQDSVARKVEVLQQRGPSLGRPDVDGIKSSRYPNMKELRVQQGGDAYRILFAFDPRRTGILLLGGRKSDTKWYKTAVPTADKLY